VTKKHFRSAFLLALTAPLLGLAAAPAAAGPVAWPFSSCQNIHTQVPWAPDGNYTLSNNGRIFSVYCYDMSGNPREYIDLVNTASAENFSQYTAGGASPGTDVRTSFTKLRVDPATLTVDIGDLTFATSTGSLLHDRQRVSSMPYGVAMSCVAPNQASGLGNIDLRGTAFQVANAFVVGGFRSSGTATPSANNQVVDLTGGGYCGWISPAPPMYNPFNPSPGDFHLRLACAQNAITARHPALCVQAR
jgi:hypothetical protein